MTPTFDHEKLEVYQQAMRFTMLTQDILSKVPKHLSVHNQLDRASTSIALNIAEGNGKYSPKDRCRFLAIARGSALECSACLDILQARNIAQCDNIEEAKSILLQIVSMLVGLIRHLSPETIPYKKP